MRMSFQDPQRIREYWYRKQAQQAPDGDEFWKQGGYREAPRKVLDHYTREAEKVRPDLNLTDAARLERFRELKREANSQMNAALRWAREQKERELAKLYAQSNPAPQINRTLTAGEVAQREAMKNDLLRRFERHPAAILESYKDVLARGGGVLADMYEEYASEYIEDAGERGEFNALAEERRMVRMTPQQLEAHRRAEEIIASEGEMELGWAHARGVLEGRVAEIGKDHNFVTRDDVIGRQNAFRGGDNG